METLERLSARIATTTGLGTVVRTMKSLSIVKFRQFERAQRAIGAYAHTVELGLQAAVREAAAPAVPAGKAEGLAAAVIVGSDHGLCGRFNEEVVAFAHRRLGDRRLGLADTAQLAVGERIAAGLEAAASPAETVVAAPNTPAAIADATNAVLIAVDRWRQSHGVSQVLLFRNLRGETGGYEPAEAVVLPVDPAWLEALAARRWPARGLPMHTMETERLLDVLLRQRLFAQVYRCIAESLVGEHATRLAIMQAAERNIGDRLDEMNAEYRRLRQDSITAELLDAASGYEAMRGKRSDTV